jgi:transcriptional antiterminator RfaH
MKQKPCISPPEEKHWRALYVNSRAEKKVWESLLDKNVEAYVPLIKTMRQWSDRKKWVELPLMNGYIFVRISESENNTVMQTKGVVNFVRSEGRIALIREEEIMRLRKLVDLGYHLEVSPLSKHYKEGDRVKISSGALKGLEGYVVGSRDQGQIDILLESIGQCIHVKLPKELLSAIS